MFSSATTLRKAVGEYILDEPLFIDSFTSTFRAFHVHSSQEALVRIIETSTLSMIENSYQLMQDEIQILQQVSHPNLIRLVNLFSTRNNCYIIYENCSGGSLESHININRFIPENETIKLLHEILGVYGELYRRNIVLKSIRLDSFVLHNKSVKLFDISLVKNFEKFKKDTFIKANIKFWFSLAPELYFGSPQTNKCDIWSLGLIFYQMLFGELPWRSDNVEEFFKAAVSQPPNFANKYQKVSKITISTISKMLQPDPAKRISYEDLFKDPLFTSYYDMLQEREQRVIEKIRRNPECWQAASMMYTSDPLISIFDLTESIRNSIATKSVLKKSLPPIPENPGADLNPVNSLSAKNQQTLQQSGLKSQARGQSNAYSNDRMAVEGISQGMQGSGFTAYDILEAEIKSLGMPHQTQAKNQVVSNPPKTVYEAPQQVVQKVVHKPHAMNQSVPVITKAHSSIGERPQPMFNNAPAPSFMKNNAEANTSNSTTEQKPQSMQGSVSKKPNLMESSTQKPSTPQEPSSDVVTEFRKYNSRINYLCEYFQLYSQAASSATKLFKTEMIIFQCFFLYKKLFKSFSVIYDALLNNDNIFKFKHWEEYIESTHFTTIVETLESHLLKVEDIFMKIHKDCLKKLNDPLLKIERMRGVITTDFTQAETSLNSFVLPYLEKFVASEEGISEQERKLLILKHKIELVNVLLLNKMPESRPEEVIVSIREHKEVIVKEDT